MTVRKEGAPVSRLGIPRMRSGGSPGNRYSAGPHPQRRPGRAPNGEKHFARR
jgi:hypothetical protein